MNSELEGLYQEVLLDHAKRPRNFGEIANGAVHVHGDNPSCGDEFTSMSGSAKRDKWRR
jgi:nitrogen fixation NifU-like protein